MPRKRDRWTRDRAKRGRPNTAAPKTGWRLPELAQLAGIPASTVQYYARRHLLRPLQFRGTATRYQRRELLVLLGLRQLEAEGKSTLADRKRRLDALSEPELERLVSSHPISTAAAAALGLERLPAIAALEWMNASPASSERQGLQREAASATSDDAWPRTVTQTELGRSGTETWHRIALLPGLDLMLRADAPFLARAAAQRICNELRGSHE